mmetsp:Transcript_23028/g.44937  ORF Transcript_23028/g.44937 Transcript_23028/m.44937 type:complete len:326 (+) Transcript_23028:379-1356(+)
MVPMIGFGAMDNFVMIQAGDLIDNTLGVKFGLATLTAAAFGQICSDVSGVAFGGVIEAAATKLGLPVADLSPKQRIMTRVKIVGTMGSLVGVVLGCLLGMVSLLFLDLEAAERAKREKELDAVFQTVIEHGSKSMDAERASLFLLDHDEKFLWSRVATGAEGETIKVPSNRGLIGVCATTAQPLVCHKPYEHPCFLRDIDTKLHFKTRNVICYPVLSATHISTPPSKSKSKSNSATSASSSYSHSHSLQSSLQRSLAAAAAAVKEEEDARDTVHPPHVLGVLEIINKRSGEFTEEDKKLCEMMAFHVSMFLWSSKHHPHGPDDDY